MGRTLTDFEKSWVKKVLKSLQLYQYNSDFNIKELINKVNDLEVIWQCDCGAPNCHTIYFQEFHRGEIKCIADGYTHDGRNIFIFIHKYNKKLAMAEIY